MKLLLYCKVADADILSSWNVFLSVTVITDCRIIRETVKEYSMQYAVEYSMLNEYSSNT